MLAYYAIHKINFWGHICVTKCRLRIKNFLRGFKTSYPSLKKQIKIFRSYKKFVLYCLSISQIVHNETGTYITELLTREAENLIHGHNTSQPLFLYVSHQAVHSGNADDPLQVPQEYLERVKHVKNDKRRRFAGMNYHTCFFYKHNVYKHTEAQIL